MGSAQAQTAVTVSITPTAKLVRDGTVRLVVVASYAPGHQVLEAHVSVSQDDQRVVRQTGIPVRCDGRSLKSYVTVSPLEGAFHVGEAVASAFLLICADPACTTTAQGQDARTIRVR
jgi:hypothetical protein